MSKLNELYTYVVGGMYGETDRKKFGLVHPSGSERPYYTNNPNSSIIRIGNSAAALYMIDFEKGLLKKQPDKHYELNGPQPDVVEMSKELADMLTEAISEGKTYIA